MSRISLLVLAPIKRSHWISAPRLLPLRRLNQVTPTCGWRSFATHSDGPFPNPTSNQASSSRTTREDDVLHRLEAEVKRHRKSGFEGQETVGPFPLGVGPSGRAKAWRKWRELGIGGKLVRATRQTGNLTVILFGGTLFIILVYALSTELFAKNSPSVLYSQAVDLIRASDALNPHLLPPLTFSHHPQPSAPIRGTSPIRSRHVIHPSSNREHLILTFWVHGRGIGEPETLGWVKAAYRTALEYARKGGEWAGITPPIEESEPTQDTPSTVDNQVVRESSSGWFGGLVRGFGLGGLKSGSDNKRVVRNRSVPPGTYKVGEVNGDYVKNASGQYQLLALTVDIPASNAPHPGRAVIFWSPEADSEGLIRRS